MSSIIPFRAYLADKSLLSATIAPPYDVIDVEQARCYAASKPSNFLHLTKPEIDALNDKPTTLEALSEQAKLTLNTFIDKQWITQDDQPAFYLYRVTFKNHQQTGFFAAIDTELYLSNTLKKHELTREKKEEERLQYILAQNGHVSPAFIIHQAHDELQTLINTHCNAFPATLTAECDFDQTCHEIWRFDNVEKIKTMQRVIHQLKQLIIADGHHRIAAAARAYQINPKAKYFLAALFPDDQCQIFGYHRVIHRLSRPYSEILTQIAKIPNIQIKKIEKPFFPTIQRQFGFYLNSQWYQLELPNPKESHLDASLLTEKILTPIFNIDDLRQDPNIDFIGGPMAENNIQSLISKELASAIFTLAPVTTQDLILTTAQDQIMPPKSTWFHPKLLDGLITLLFN